VTTVRLVLLPVAVLLIGAGLLLGSRATQPMLIAGAVLAGADLVLKLTT